jgi:hypothetical protein
MTGAQRGRLLRRLADLIEQDVESLVAIEALDAGKPLAASRRQDLPAAIDCLEYYAGWADKISGEVAPARNDALTYVTRQPVGVVAAIVPWIRLRHLFQRRAHIDHHGRAHRLECELQRPTNIALLAGVSATYDSGY